MRKAWSHLIGELRQWSLTHFVFDACVTGVISLLIGHVADMPWYLLLLTILFTAGAVSSGMILARNSVTTSTPAPVMSERQVAITNAIDQMILNIETATDVEDTKQKSFAVYSELAGMFPQTPEIPKGFLELFGHITHEQWTNYSDRIRRRVLAYLRGVRINNHSCSLETNGVQSDSAAL